MVSSQVQPAELLWKTVSSLLVLALSMVFNTSSLRTHGAYHRIRTAMSDLELRLVQVFVYQSITISGKAKLMFV